MNTMKTRILQAYLILCILAGVFSCAPKAYPPDVPNPLDEPGYTEPTVAELHLKNLRLITSDHARQ